MDKIKLTSAQLYSFMQENGVKMTRLAELAGITRYQLSGYFNKTSFVSGLKRRFTEDTVQPINEALPRLAEQIRNAQIDIQPNEIRTVRNREYYPVCVQRIKNRIGPWLNIKQILHISLGWSSSQIGNVMMSPNSRAYGNITAQHIFLINTSLRQIAAALEGFQLLPDTVDDSSSSSSN